MMDQFKTIREVSEGEYKEKGSRFIAFLFPAKDRSEFDQNLATIKSTHHKARHHCWAYKLGMEPEEAFCSDDGEPSGSAGRPILNQIFSAELHNVGMVVVRYFGGVKLGVPGLIRSYKLGSQAAIDNAAIYIHKVLKQYRIHFSYALMSEVMYITKSKDVQGLETHLTDSPNVVIGLLPSDSEHLIEKIIKILLKYPEDYAGELPLTSELYDIEYIGQF